MIVSRQNRKIKDMRRLRRSKGDRALLEGPHLVAEALASGVSIEYALATPRMLESGDHARLFELLGDRLEAVEAGVLESIADVDSPRGVAAVAELPRAGLDALGEPGRGVYLFAEGLQEPGNLGALARVAEATGVAGLALGAGSAHPNHPRALRASAGSLLRLPVAREVGLDALLEWLALEKRPEVLALQPRGGDDLFELQPAVGPTLLLIGAEGPGLSAGALAVADRTVSVPMTDPVESLNATVAAAVVLYELSRRNPD